MFLGTYPGQFLQISDSLLTEYASYIVQPVKAHGGKTFQHFEVQSAMININNDHILSIWVKSCINACTCFRTLQGLQNIKAIKRGFQTCINTQNTCSICNFSSTTESIIHGYNIIFLLAVFNSMYFQFCMVLFTLITCRSCFMASNYTIFF